MKNFLPLLIFFLTCSAHADQYLPDQLKDDTPLKESISDVDEEGSPYLQLSEEQKKEIESGYKEIDSSQDHINTKKDLVSGELSKQQKQSNEDGHIAGKNLNGPEYLEKKSDESFLENQKLSKKRFAFSLYKDQFSYRSKRNNFSTIYREGPYRPPIMLLLSADYLLARFGLEFYIGGNFGLGYNQGKGAFIDGTRSKTTFTLWAIPIDFSLGIELPIASWVKLAGSGGPSMMVLYQNRSDLDSGDPKTALYQRGQGYFWNGNFQLDLTRIFTDVGINMFRQYTITRIMLTTGIRYHSYSGFKSKDIRVSGKSFAIGFNFEFM